MSAVAIAVVCGWSSSVHADRINEMVQVGLNDARDENAEYLAVDNDQDGNLDVDDVIQGVFDMDRLNSAGGANVGGLTGNSEWGGIFRLKVTGKIDNGGGDFTFTFGPDSGFSKADEVLGTTGNTQNAMALMWDDTTPNANWHTDIPTAEASSSDGDFYWAFGFNDAGQASRVEGGSVVSDNGEGWVGSGSEAFTAAAGANPGTFLGGANFAVNRVDDIGLANGLPLPLVDQELGAILASILGADASDQAQIIGSSELFGAEGVVADAGFHAKSGTDFTFVMVPSPTAASAGVMLLGLMVFRRRRKTA